MTVGKSASCNGFRRQQNRLVVGVVVSDEWQWGRARVVMAFGNSRFFFWQDEVVVDNSPSTSASLQLSLSSHLTHSQLTIQP
ncbi:hypothetical protein Tco_0639572 [Tanacetum coccineum]